MDLERKMKNLKNKIKIILQKIYIFFKKPSKKQILTRKELLGRYPSIKYLKKHQVTKYVLKRLIKKNKYFLDYVPEKYLSIIDIEKNFFYILKNVPIKIHLFEHLFKNNDYFYKKIVEKTIKEKDFLSIKYLKFIDPILVIKAIKETNSTNPYYLIPYIERIQTLSAKEIIKYSVENEIDLINIMYFRPEISKRQLYLQLFKEIKENNFSVENIQIYQFNFSFPFIVLYNYLNSNITTPKDLKKILCRKEMFITFLFIILMRYKIKYNLSSSIELPQILFSSRNNILQILSRENIVRGFCLEFIKLFANSKIIRKKVYLCFTEMANSITKDKNKQRDIALTYFISFLDLCVEEERSFINGKISKSNPEYKKLIKIIKFVENNKILYELLNFKYYLDNKHTVKHNCVLLLT
jgi:hypothetical protein